jgi:hypothetical protein
MRDRERGRPNSRTRHRLGLVGVGPGGRVGVSDSASSGTRLGLVVCGFNRLAWPRGRLVYLVYLDSVQRPCGTGVGKVLVLFSVVPLSYFFCVFSFNLSIHAISVQGQIHQIHRNE